MEHSGLYEIRGYTGGATHDTVSCSKDAATGNLCKLPTDTAICLSVSSIGNMAIGDLCRRPAVYHAVNEDRVALMLDHPNSFWLSSDLGFSTRLGDQQLADDRVGKIYVVSKNGAKSEVCTGATVTGGLVVTAGHCFLNVPQPYNVYYVPGMSEEVTNLELRAPYGVFEAVSMIRNGGGKFDSQDYAIIKVKNIPIDRFGDIRIGLRFLQPRIQNIQPRNLPAFVPKILAPSCLSSKELSSFGYSTSLNIGFRQTSCRGMLENYSRLLAEIFPCHLSHGGSGGPVVESGFAVGQNENLAAFLSFNPPARDLSASLNFLFYGKAFKKDLSTMRAR